MRFTRNTQFQRNIVSLLFGSMLLGPVIGCESSKTDSSASQPTETESLSTPPGITKSSWDNAWEIVTETTNSRLIIVSEKISAGSTMALNAGQTAWIWSADTTNDGWQWISNNAGDATQWATCSMGNTWILTKEKCETFSLWVQIKATNGTAWARTVLPATWRVVKDTAGIAWVWSDEHKVAVAAAVIKVVATGLIIAPEGTHQPW